MPARVMRDGAVKKPPPYQSNSVVNSTGVTTDVSLETSVCMILPGGGLRLQTLGGLAAQLFDSTLRTFQVLGPIPPSGEELPVVLMHVTSYGRLDQTLITLLSSLWSSSSFSPFVAFYRQSISSNILCA